jgi:hypothetical protein
VRQPQLGFQFLVAQRDALYLIDAFRAAPEETPRRQEAFVDRRFIWRTSGPI